MAGSSGRSRVAEVAYVGVDLVARLNELLDVIAPKKSSFGRDEREPSLRQLNEEIGASKEFLGSIVKGKSTSPEALPLARLCELYQFNVRWLLTGRGRKRLEGADHLSPPAGPARGEDVERAARTVLAVPDDDEDVGTKASPLPLSPRRSGPSRKPRAR